MMKLAILTFVALLSFAANSVLTRLGLASNEIDALGFTGVRLVSGALTLAGVLYLRSRVRGDKAIGIGGSWRGAAVLFGYAIAFSTAYLMLGAGTGALILFAAVQVSILLWAAVKGARPGRSELVGIAIAFGGLAYLVSPGLVAPDALGASLMVGAGICWACYTLLGRGSRSPLADTSGNFLRCLPVGLALALGGMLTHAPSAAGLAYAIGSGALASGLGYAVWYWALPGLSRARTGLIQLLVPALAAAGGVLFIGEPLTFRLILSTVAILTGVALALFAGEMRKARIPTG